MQFAWPWAFLLLPLVPVAAWWPGRRRRRAAVSYPSVEPIRGIARGARARLLWLGPACRAAAMGLMVVALARPQHGVGRVETDTNAVAIQVVVDRSGSMGQEMEFDGQPSTRLDTVKRVLREFVEGNAKRGGELKGREQDIIGLITFARYAETVCPLVRDPKALIELSEQINLAQQRWEDGTSIGDALALAAARLRRAEDELASRANPGNGAAPKPPGGSDNQGLKIKSKIIVLFTDGANNAGERAPLEAAKLAADWGIKVYPIAIGTGTTYQTLRDPFFGERRIRVPSDVDTKMLSEMARITGGVYHSADDAQAIRDMYAEIDRLEKTSVEMVQYIDYQEKFTPWAAGGGALLMMEVLLGTVLLRRMP
jgi:Ca-activated chloride channel homolog